MEVLTRITELAVRQFGVDADSLGVDVPVGEYGIDSLGLIEFLFVLEDEFDIRFPEERGDQPQTLRQLAEQVVRLQAGSATLEKTVV